MHDKPYNKPEVSAVFTMVRACSIRYFILPLYPAAPYAAPINRSQVTSPVPAVRIASCGQNCKSSHFFSTISRLIYWGGQAHHASTYLSSFFSCRSFGAFVLFVFMFVFVLFVFVFVRPMRGLQVLHVQLLGRVAAPGPSKRSASKAWPAGFSRWVMGETVSKGQRAA